MQFSPGRSFMLSGSERTTLFLGNFGSGKTEVAVNFALYMASQPAGRPVALADLDLVNPYFRSREARFLLMDAGITVILPDQSFLHADLPILAPEVRAALMASSALAPYLILDVGGDDVGARVLGALSDALTPGSYRALMVVNASRPMTSDVPGVEEMRARIEAAGRLHITGMVSNAHLMEQTTIETLVEGRSLARASADAAGLSLEFVCAPAPLADTLSQLVDEDVLPINRYLTPPWLQPATPAGSRLGKALFRL